MVNAVKKRWYENLPHPFILLFMIILLAAVMTYVVPAGEYTRVVVNGRKVVDPATFHAVAQSPVSFMDIFMSIPLGIIASASVVVITFMSGAMFNVLQSTGAIENGVGWAVKKIGVKNYKKLIWIVILILGLLGATVGFENNIGIVPIAVFVAIALGGDPMVGAGMAIAGIGIGFATSPINPYTVGTAHAVAELPIYSGIVLRSLFCLASIMIAAQHTCHYMDKILKDPSKSLVSDVDLTGLTLSKPLEDYNLSTTDKLILGTFIFGLGFTVFGVLKWGWYLNQMSAMFVIITIIAGIVARIRPNDLIQRMIKGAGDIAGGALVIGVARGIQVILDQGHICDSIIHALVAPLQGLGVTMSAILMSLVHCVINFFIPSGSGQAMATMPIMIPLSDLVGMTRQTAILAFQIGDGVTNLIYPTLGGMLAMLALTRVPFDRWFRFAFPLVVKVVLVSWVFLIIAVQIGWN